MAKKHSKNSDINDNDFIPPGEDQYLLGGMDAERLENLKPGAAKAFVKFANVAPGFHSEYIKGFNAYIVDNIPESAPEMKINTDNEELTRVFLQILQKELKSQ